MDHQYKMAQAYDKSNGYVISDVTWSVAGGRRCARLAEVSFSSFYRAMLRRQQLQTQF